MDVWFGGFDLLANYKYRMVPRIMLIQHNDLHDDYSKERMSRERLHYDGRFKAYVPRYIQC